jgi:hypothetical protein
MGILNLFRNQSKSENVTNSILSQNDIGKVYIIENRKSEQNFGRFLILLSTISEDTYAFNTFDIIDNIPVGKLVVSFSKKLNYKEAKLDDELLQKAKEACELRMSKERDELQEEIKLRSENSARMKEIFNIDSSFVFSEFGDIINSNLKYGIWIDPAHKQFVLHIYYEREILKVKTINWINDPMWEISNEDQKVISENLNKLLTELKNEINCR